METPLSRRRLLQVGGAIGAGAFAGCGGLLGGETVDRDSWPMRGCGPKNQGCHPSAAGPGENMETEWTRSASDIAAAAGIDMEEPTISRPIIADGSVFVALWDPVTVSGLYCCRLDGEGATEWMTEPILDNYLPAAKHDPTVAVVDETVVLTVPRIPEDLSLVALDASSGSIEWEAEGNSWTPPTIYDDDIVVGGTDPLVRGFGVDGSPDWNYSATGPEGKEIWPARFALPVTDDRVYVPTRRSGEVHSLDRSGNRQWRTEITRRDPLSESDSRTYGPVVGEYVYVATGSYDWGGDGWLLALDQSDGSVVWEFQPAFEEQRRQSLIEKREQSPFSGPLLNVGVYGKPVLVEDTLVIRGRTFRGDMAEGSKPFVFGLDPASGDQKWSRHVPDYFLRRDAVAADGTVFFPSVGDSAILAVDAASGSIQGSFDASETADGLAVAGESLFARDGRSIRKIGPA